MQALTSYQHAHDAAGERESNRDDAIDAAFWSLVNDKDDLIDQIEQMISRDDIQPAELIAMLYISQMRKGVQPEWFSESRLTYVMRNLESNINDELGKEAQSRVDAESSNEQ